MSDSIEALEAENRDLRVDIEIKRKRLEDAEKMLKTVLDREAASIARHDARIEALEAELERMTDD